MKEHLRLQGFDYVEFFVGSSKMVAYWYTKALGFDIKAYSGPETGIRDRSSYYLTKNNIKIVVTSAVKPATAEVLNFTNLHGDGVKRIFFSVESVEDAWSIAVKKGAVPILSPRRLTDAQGFVDEAFIRAYDDTEIGFINFTHYKGLFRPGFGAPVQKYEVHCEDTGLQAIDHIVGNVRINEMDSWVNYFNKTLGFETFISFGPGDISTQYSALLSKVVRSRDTHIKMPVNEPYKGLKKSQIQEYIDEYYGSGVQHIALSTHDIISSIRSLRKNGVEFLEVPDTYYDTLKKRELEIDEDVDTLKELGILCDIEGQGYLLQLFTKPIGDRPTFFFEVIQRKNGSSGFGQGNFQALFEAIERDQARRGNL